jgi:hypothetical protein
MRMMTDSVVYVYLVGDAVLAESADMPSIDGIDGTPVRIVVSGGLAAVVSSVDGVRFSEEALKHSFEDLQWLEDTARAHHGVVDAVALSHPVVPVRLATVYLDDDRVRAVLDEQGAAFTAALHRVRGRTEWGVKAFAAAAAADHPEPEAVSGAAGPGTSYLMRRRAARDRAAVGHRQAVDAAEEAHREIARLAVASRRYPPQDPRLTGHRDEMVLNAAYLVDDARAATVRRAVENWDASSVRLELTGPWAPYSFATLEEP